MIVYFSRNGGCKLFEGVDSYDANLCTGSGATTNVKTEVKVTR